MASPYNDIVLEHFKNPRNTGRIESPDGKATEGSPACGDMVSLYLNVDPEAKVITDIKFESYGCASNIATGSIITELAKGKTIEEAKKITWQDASEALGAPENQGPLLRSSSGSAAFGDSELRRKTWFGDKKEVTTEEIVRKRLKKVMNPIKGLDMVATHLVKEIEIKNGVVRIALDLPENHQFANAIKEDAIEKIESLWDINQVIVEFTD